MTKGKLMPSACERCGYDGVGDYDWDGIRMLCERCAQPWWRRAFRTWWPALLIAAIVVLLLNIIRMNP